MRQGRAEFVRMWRQREVAGSVDAQGFTFDSAQALRQQWALAFERQQRNTVV
jgi:hypothetical protein